MLQKAVSHHAKGGILDAETPPFTIPLPISYRQAYLRLHGAKMCAHVKNIKNLIVLQKFRLTLHLKNTS